MLHQSDTSEFPTKLDDPPDPTNESARAVPPAQAENQNSDAVNAPTNVPARASGQVRRRRRMRGPVSIYRGRQNVGSVAPQGERYCATDAAGRRVGFFDKYDDAIAAVTAHRGGQ